MACVVGVVGSAVVVDCSCCASLAVRVFVACVSDQETHTTPTTITMMREIFFDSTSLLIYHDHGVRWPIRWWSARSLR